MRIILSLMVLVILGLAIEKLIHLDYDIAEVTMSLKKDIKQFVKALFREPQIRHTFDITLSDDIKAVVKPYAKAGFDVKLINRLRRNVPAIGIQFVPEHELSETELQELMRLLVIQFREYVAYYGLNWQMFATYSVGSDYVHMFLFYSEWECDIHSFINVYRQTVRHKMNKFNGVLRDEDLEEEMKHVH